MPYHHKNQHFKCQELGMYNRKTYALQIWKSFAGIDFNEFKNIKNLLCLYFWNESYVNMNKQKDALFRPTFRPLTQQIGSDFKYNGNGFLPCNG